MSQIKALILAGGFGTRLRPLSCYRPKLLFPIAGKPIIDWVLDGLSKNGIDEAILATNYLDDMIKDHLGKRYGKVRLHYSLEEKPLGTGGAIKEAERFLRGEKFFFVLNGDIVSSPPLRQILHQHTRKKATVTIMLKKVEDPTHFGVARLGKETKIIQFVEKPRLEDAPSRWINAGVYLLNSEIFSYLSPRTKSSIEKEVFPVLASSGKLFGYKYAAEWFDIGRFSEYRKANNVILSREAGSEPRIAPGAEVKIPTKLIPPLTISGGSRVEQATLGPYTSVGKKALIHEGSRISESILFDKVIVGKNSTIRGAIIGESVFIGNNVRIGENCVIGDHVFIHDNIAIKHDVRICPYKEVHRSIDRPGIVS
ncbi:MAG: NDP-sugar synthase [Candidatus Bathyarchaeota archaeon]|nr:NDP-sugar synthase [Candidatus Bathyarchaeota archaeon]